MSTGKDVLVFGQTGQVAQELAQLWPDAVFLGREQADLTDPQACARAVITRKCRAVVNAAAYTAVDRAETEADLAGVINTDAPAAMAAAAKACDAAFLHISTDYVFDGTTTMSRDETAPPAPLNTYGATKLAGEQAVRAACPGAVILRTSWVFSAHGNNFVKTMLRLGAGRDRLSIVADQIGGPTPARAIAQAVDTIIGAVLADPARGGGLYHFAGAPDTSWAGFAREIFEQSGMKVQIEDIPTRAYPTPAPRPLNSRLNCDAIARDFGVSRPDWRAGLAEVLQGLKGTA